MHTVKATLEGTRDKINRDAQVIQPSSTVYEKTSSIYLQYIYNISILSYNILNDVGPILASVPWAAYPEPRDSLGRHREVNVQRHWLESNLWDNGIKPNGTGTNTLKAIVHSLLYSTSRASPSRALSS
jgi:hypothetical protein